MVLCVSPLRLNAEESAKDTQKLVLDNGTTIVTRYVPDSEITTVQIRVLSGLSNEGEYAGSGISHLLEHLIFKGTQDKNAEEVRKTIKMMGGIVNGSTGMDSAEYHITVPNENFEEALLLISDIVMNLNFTDEEFETEREVVLKEIKLRKDTPTTKRLRLLFAQAYRDHVYKYPILGYEDRLKRLTREDLMRYHNAVYRPDRIVVGVVGGVSPETVLEVAEKKFKYYGRGEVWTADIQTEPRQLTERVSENPEEVVVGYLAIGFHSTSVYSPDLYPGDVLSILLGEGNDSRLNKRLVKEKELLYNIGSFNYTPRYPGLFVISGIGEPDKLKEAREEIFAVIEELKTGKLKNDEIERAKNIVISRFFHSHESVKSVTSSITSSQLITGDPSFYEKYVGEIQKVGKAGIKDFAARYFTRDNSTTVTLVPRKMYEESIQKEEKEAAEKDEEKTVFSQLENGLRVIVKKKNEYPIAAVALIMPGGLRAEDKNTSGLSNLTASMLTKGTKKRDEDEIIPALERMGGSISAFSGVNSMGLTMKVMSGDLDKGLDIFEDVVKNAIFPTEEARKAKEKIMAAIMEQEMSIFDKGLLEFRSLLFGDHPYSMRILGELDTVKTFFRDDIVAYYSEYWGAKNAVLSVVGDVDPDEVIRNIEKRFGSWTGGEREVQDQKAAPLERPRHKDLTMRREQSLFLLGFIGVEVTDDRRYALQAISSILSGSDGLLFYAVREKHGFTYSSGAISIPAVDPGYFLMYVATAEQNLERVKEKVIEVVNEIIKGDFGEEEIEAAKHSIITQHASSIETDSSLGMTMIIDELYGLGYDNYSHFPDKIRAVTKEEIVETAKEILDLTRSAEVVIHSSKQ
jgi:zinc protease